MAIDHVPCIPPAHVRLMESQYLCGHGRLALSCQFSSDWWAQSAYKPAQTSICNQLRTFNWPTVCKYWRSIGELESTSASATCSQKTRYPPVMAPSLAITFGVEFEMVLAFHEKDLVRIMRQNNIEAQIKKEFSKAEHVALLGTSERYKNLAASQRSHFPGWALLTNEDDPVLALDENELPRCGLLRRYLMEPVVIAQDALQQNGCQSEVVGPAKLYPNDLQGIATHRSPAEVQHAFQEELDYSEWALMGDYSLTGATKAQLLVACPGRITKANVGSWDSFGIELVSRIFQVADKEPSISEMGSYLAALEGSTTSEDARQDSDTHCSTLNSVFAGTHVHIGFNINGVEEVREAFPVFQHLAYILISHEDLLTQLHPLHRSGECAKEWTEIAARIPQLDGESEEQQAEGTVEASEKAWRGWREVCSNAHWMAGELKTDGKTYWADFRTAIFSEEDRKEASLLSLVQMMQEYSFRTDGFWRGYHVNWSNLVGHVLSSRVDREHHQNQPSNSGSKHAL